MKLISWNVQSKEKVSDLSPTKLANRQLGLVKRWKERILPVTMSSTWGEIDLYNIYTVHYHKGYMGLKYDHVFASKVLRPKSAEYLHEFRTEHKLSDHSPLEVVFEF